MGGIVLRNIPKRFFLYASVYRLCGLASSGGKSGLVRNPPNDGVTGCGVTKIHYPNLSVMSINDISNNGVNGTGLSNDEGSSPGRGPLDELGGPGRNHVTAK